MFVKSPIVIEGREQITVAANDHSDALRCGVYDVWATADAYIKVGTVADDVTSSTGYLVPANTVVSVRIARADLRIGASAEIHIHQVA